MSTPQASKSSPKAPEHLTGCLIVKPSGIEEIVVSPARKSITMKEGNSSNTNTIPGTSDPFVFNSRMFVNMDEFTSGAYSSMVGPLVKKTCAGENTTAVIGGPSSLDFSEYLLSSSKSRGLLSQAANQMLNSILVEGKREGTVTFSWYKVDCTGTDGVDDILRSASEAGMPAGERTNNADLSVKELERGRGVTVPGLWEVELSTSSDVDAVITHVQRISSEAKHESGTAHSVIQLTVTSEHIRNSNTAFGLTGGNTHAELKGLGKISFVVLGNLKPRQFAGEEWEKQAFNPWVDDILTTIQWIESKEIGSEKSGPLPTNPKSSNSTSTVLKDVLRGRQTSCMLLMLVPTKVLVNETRQWLLLGEAIENTRDAYVKSGMANSPVPNSQSRFSSPHPTSSTKKPSRPVMTPGQFNGMNTPHALLPPPPPASTTTTPAPKSPKEHHDFVEGGAGYEMLNTARDEIRALNEALRVKNDMLEEAQAAYNMLVTQLQEDGSTLKQKDRERYRQVLTELKDYEIYKNVMEAALTKMQGEMEALLGENNALKNKVNQKEGDLRRKEVFKDQYSKDLTQTRKQLTEALENAEEVMDKNKELLKQAEAVRLNTTALKHDRTMLKKDNEAKEAQLAKLTERLLVLEDKEKTRAKEEARMRDSTRATLESCMNYQEENELLKAALAEMLEDAAKNPAPVRSSSPSPRQSRTSMMRMSQGGMSPMSSSSRGSTSPARMGSPQRSQSMKRQAPAAPPIISAMKGGKVAFAGSDGETTEGETRAGGVKKVGGYRGSVVFQREKEERQQQEAEAEEQAQKERKISDASVLFPKEDDEGDEGEDDLGEMTSINAKKKAAAVAARHRRSILT